MSEDAKKPIVKLVDTGPPEDIFNDIEGLRKVATLKVSRRVVTVNVAVKRPANNVYFRCHPDPEMSLEASIIIGDGGSDDYYFVAPNMLNHHTMLPRLSKVIIAVVYSWPGGVISLWPVPNVDETRIDAGKARARRLNCPKAHGFNSAGTTKSATTTSLPPRGSPPSPTGRRI